MDAAIEKVEAIANKIDEVIAPKPVVEPVVEAPLPGTQKKEKKNKQPQGPVLPKIVADFETLNIRISQVKTCIVPEYSEKLLEMTLDIGNGETRKFAAGVAAFYKPEDLIGRKLVTILNLKPRPMVGGAIISEAMLFAGSNEDHSDVKIVVPNQEAPAGTRVVLEGYENPADPKDGDPKKAFTRVADALIVKDKLMYCDEYKVIVPGFGPIECDMADGCHIG